MITMAGAAEFAPLVPHFASKVLDLYAAVVVHSEPSTSNLQFESVQVVAEGVAGPHVV